MTTYNLRTASPAKTRADAVVIGVLQHDKGASGAVSYTNILDWLQGRVASLQVYNFRGTKIPFLRNRPATIFVDEVRVDYSVLNMIAVPDIALIKVVPNAFALGVNTSGGAIAIYTKRGEGDEEED